MCRKAEPGLKNKCNFLSIFSNNFILFLCTKNNFCAPKIIFVATNYLNLKIIFELLIYFAVSENAQYF